MPKVSYPFIKLPRAPVARPYILINVVNPKNKKNSLEIALLDTGADSCMFPGDLAIKLGHNLKGHNVKVDIGGGVGGGVGTWEHTFIIQLLHPKHKKVVWESDRVLRINCIDSNNIPILLGSSNFFRKFKVIHFDYKNENSIIEW